jgi:hypothetical protein
MGKIKIKIETENKTIEQLIHTTNGSNLFTWTVCDMFLEDHFTINYMREYLPLNEGVWVPFDRQCFMWAIEEIINDFVQISELDRDWLADKIDQEMYNTCEYSTRMEGYKQSDRITKLYETVEGLCDLIDDGELLWLRQEDKFRGYILHLKREGIDEDCLDIVLNNLKEFRQQIDSHSLWFIYHSLSISDKTFIYFQHY